MYVEPNTHLEFFQDLHIDPDYENTIYFPTTQAKDNYFANLTSIKTPKCYYQRERRGYCRVEIPIRNLLDRSYMRFKNDSFEDKWFYAFILDVEYVNNITTEVHYQIDVMMTWCGGGYTLDQCFVERNHTITDSIGDNIVPERFELNRYVNNNAFTSNQSSPQRSGVIGSTQSEWVYLVVLEPDLNDQPSGLQMGYYSGLNYVVKDTAQDLTTYLQSFLPAIEQPRIQGIFYVPKYFIPTGQQVAPKQVAKSIYKPIAGDTTLDGYEPKNNKMYTYPYNYLSVLNTEGEEVEFPFENFSTTNVVQFNIRGIVGEQTQITCTPVDYETSGVPILDMPVDPRKQLTMKDFPSCAWTNDTFKAFLAQQMVSLPYNLIHGVAQTAIGNVYYGITGTTASLAHTAENALKASIRPKEARGANMPQLSTAGLYPYKDFWFFRISLRADEAKRIDDYFTMFGYAINECAVPNVNARPYYTYVKTIGCHINGSLPAGDQREIEEIFNRGVRFWKESHLHIGDYTVNNSPV